MIIARATGRASFRARLEFRLVMTNSAYGPNVTAAASDVAQPMFVNVRCRSKKSRMPHDQVGNGLARNHKAKLSHFAAGRLTRDINLP